MGVKVTFYKEMDLYNSLLWFSFFSEFYHSVTHLTVLTGYRMLPRKDLVRARLYFLLDAACAALAFSLHRVQYFYPLLILQQWQHIFYYSTWDKSAAAKRVISWSSLDWDRGRWNQLDLVLGTAFDLFVHLANTYFIGTMLGTLAQISGGTAALILYYVIIQNTTGATAWSSPRNMPAWVLKRVRPLTAEQVQEVAWMENLSGK